jgi:hypothetical protein
MDETCVCQNIEYNNICYYCHRYFKPSEISVRFKAKYDYLEVTFAETPIFTHLGSCRDMFYEETLEKFGTGYECSIDKDTNQLIVKLGSNYSLYYRDTISLLEFNWFSKANTDCSYKIYEQTHFV